MNYFEPLEKRPTKRSEVGERLREAILNGYIKPGEKLVESRIARDFGISRAPLREAMSALAEEGLLFNEPFIGYFVIEVSEKSLSELYSMRRVLETFAFEEIWPLRDEFFFETLAERHTRLKACIVSEDKTASIKAELSLHATVFEQCGNALLLNVWRGLAGQLQLYWSLQQKSHGRSGAKIDAHEDYVMLASAGSLEQMRIEIAEHVQRGLEKTIMTLATHTADER